MAAVNFTLIGGFDCMNASINEGTAAMADEVSGAINAHATVPATSLA